MSALRRLWFWFALAALVDAGGATRVVLDSPTTPWWMLAGWLYGAAVLFAIGSVRSAQRSAEGAHINEEQT